MTNDPANWRAPYRSQDESGSKDAAGQVAHDWIFGIAKQLHDDGCRSLQVDRQSLNGGGGIIALYRGAETIAVATTWRDPLNFTILVRWAAEGIA